MPRLWVNNAEEVFDLENKSRSNILPKIREIGPRFLLQAVNNDAVLLHAPIDENFVRYISGVSGRKKNPVQVFWPDWKPGTQFIAQSAMHDHALLEALRNLTSGDGWSIEPYIETPRILDLARHLGIPAGRTSPDKVKIGLIHRWNDKLFFKSAARKAAIETIPGSVSATRAELAKELRHLRTEKPGRLMLRETFSGGGLGNISGSRSDILSNFSKWYKGGKVLIEPFIDFTDTLGSLVDINERGASFRGVDIQIFESGCWNGFRYPFRNKFPAGEIARKSIALGKFLWKLGARGSLNIDWGVTRSASGRRKLLGIEQNFRHNGFSLILDFGQAYFHGKPDNFFTHYIEGYRLSAHDLTFDHLLGKLGAEKIEKKPLLISKPDQDWGVVVTIPPVNGRCGLAIFAPTADLIEKILSRLSKLLQ